MRLRRGNWLAVARCPVGFAQNQALFANLSAIRYSRAGRNGQCHWQSRNGAGLQRALMGRASMPRARPETKIRPRAPISFASLPAMRWPAARHCAHRPCECGLCKQMRMAVTRHNGRASGFAPEVLDRRSAQNQKRAAEFSVASYSRLAACSNRFGPLTARRVRQVRQCA